MGVFTIRLSHRSWFSLFPPSRFCGRRRRWLQRLQPELGAEMPGAALVCHSGREIWLPCFLTSAIFLCFATSKVLTVATKAMTPVMPTAAIQHFMTTPYVQMMGSGILHSGQRTSRPHTTKPMVLVAAAITAMFLALLRRVFILWPRVWSSPWVYSTIFPAACFSPFPPSRFWAVGILHNIRPGSMPGSLGHLGECPLCAGQPPHGRWRI